MIRPHPWEANGQNFFKWNVIAVSKWVARGEGVKFQKMGCRKHWRHLHWHTYEWSPWTPPSICAEVVLFSNFSSPEYIMALNKGESFYTKKNDCSPLSKYIQILISKNVRNYIFNDDWIIFHWNQLCDLLSVKAIITKETNVMHVY